MLHNRRMRMTDIYTGIVSRLLFPLHEQLKGHSSTSWRKSLERSQWLSPEALKAMKDNLERLRKLGVEAIDD